MRTFEQLTKAEQEWAKEQALIDLLRAILERGLRFNDELNEDDLQARIDAAGEEAERMQTPWFAGECIMEAAGDDLRSMAQCDAEDAQYAGPDDPPVVRLPATAGAAS